MEHNNDFERLKKDSRLKDMDPERLSMLMELAQKLSDTPQNQKMTQFMMILQTASQKNVAFSKDEQDLLFSIMTEQMNPEEKKKMEMIRNLSLKLGQKK